MGSVELSSFGELLLLGFKFQLVKGKQFHADASRKGAAGSARAKFYKQNRQATSAAVEALQTEVGKYRKRWQGFVMTTIVRWPL